MTDFILFAGLQQALLLSVVVIGLRVVRPMLLRLGADFAYAAWLLVPLVLLTQALPRPTVEPLRIALTASIDPAAVGLPSIPVLPASSHTQWLANWLAGTLIVLTWQSWRQWRQTQLGERLPEGSSPALVGLIKPRVALPVDFEQQFTLDERELILEHEAIHRTRLDNLWNLLATLLTAVHWWNPLAWYAANRIQADQELACDAAVLRNRPDSTATYNHALLAAHCLRAPNAPLASHWGSTHPLIERIAMLSRPQPLTHRRIVLLGIGLLSTVGLA